MRFTVIGTDAAGLTLEFSVDARGVEEAEHMARQRGVTVAKVTLGGGGRRAEQPGSSAPVQPRPAAPVPANKPSAAPTTPPQASTRLAPRSNARVDLGLTSLALGGTALIFCWIPTVNLVSLPLGALGAAAGGCAFIGACRRPTASPRRSIGVRMAAPVGGVGLSVLALMAAGVLAAAAPETSPNGSVLPVPSTAGVATTPAPTTPDTKPRNLSIIAASSAPSGFASAPATPAATSPAATPTGPAAAATLTLGGVEIRVLSADLMQTPLIGDMGRSQGISSLDLLVLRVEVRNVSSGPIEYRTISGDAENGLRDGARLTDDRGRALARARFTLGVVPSGRVTGETLQPGKLLTDVLAFDRPATLSSRYTLSVNGDAIGASGGGEVSVPTVVQR